MLANLPAYWRLSVRQRERVRNWASSIERQRAELEAEDRLYERLQEAAEEDVGANLPQSLSATAVRIRSYAAEYSNYYPEYQENPTRFVKVYIRAYRAACRLFRETRSIWQHDG